MSPKLSDAGALAGCTVIDLSRVLGGPYCTQILADHGADVLKIEPPGGDETRAGAAVPGRDGVLLHRREPQQARHGAGSVAAGGPGALRALLADADVLVENFKPGTLEKWGLGYETLSQAFPKLIHCRVSASAPTGRWAACPATTPAPRPCAA